MKEIQQKFEDLYEEILKRNLHICFYTKDLLCKFGFEDGDILSEIISNYFGCLIDGNKVLAAVIKRYVAPCLKGNINIVYDVSISHNPVRINMINGEDVSSLWYEIDENKKPTIFPEKVFVNIPILIMFIKDNINDFFTTNDEIIETISKYHYVYKRDLEGR